MPVTVELVDNKLNIKILQGPNWNKDLEIVKSIKGRFYNGNKKVWELPVYQLTEVIGRLGSL